MLAWIKGGLWLVGITNLLGAESDSGGSDSDSGNSDSGDSSGSGGEDGGSSDSAISGDERGDGLFLYTSMHSNSDSTYSSTGGPGSRPPSKRKNDLSDDDLSEIPPQ